MDTSALGKLEAFRHWETVPQQLLAGLSYLCNIKKHREDVIAFANFITKIAQEEDITPPWITDLVRYEKIWLLANEPTSRLNRPLAKVT